MGIVERRESRIRQREVQQVIVRVLQGCAPRRLFRKLCIGYGVTNRAMNATTHRSTSRAKSTRTIGRHLPVFACCSILGLLAGCATEPESHVLSSPPPPAPAVPAQTQSTTTTTTTTASQPGSPAVIVTQAPPALQQEVVLAQPSEDHVWIPGYWTWQNGRYEWIAGRWELPPSDAIAWVPPRWEREGRGYRFYEGYWR